MATKKEIEINLKSTLDGKGVEEAKQKIDSLNKSTDQLDKGSQKATKSIKNMGQGMLQVAYFMDDVQYGIKGILNNIPGLVIGFGGGAGLAGAMSLAVLAGAKLYEWIGKTEDKSADLAKKMKEHSKEIAEASRQAIRASYQALQEFNQQERTKTVNEEYQNYVKGITREFEYQTEELEKQIRLRREEAARQKGVDTRQAELDRVNLEVGYQEGRITKRQRDYGLMMVDQNLDQKIRQRDLGVEQANYMDIGKQLAEAVKARDAAEAHAFDMQFKQGNLPSLQNILGLLQQQERVQRRIDKITAENDDLNNQIYKTSSLARVPNSEGRRYREKLEELQAKQERLLATRSAAQEEGNAVQSRLEEYQDSLRAGGVNLEFDYRQGTDISSRFKQASVAVEEFKKNTDAAKKQFDDLTEKAGSLGDAMVSTEASIKNMEQIDAIQNQIDAGKVKSFNMQRDREEAEEARRNEEKIKKARERAEREAQKQTAERQQAMIRGITLEGVPEHPTAQQRARIAAAREALNAGKKRLAESISDKDTEIDPSELQGVFDVMENVLRENGQYAKKLMDYLQTIATAQASKVNAVQADTKKYVDAKFEEILKIVQKGNGRLQTGINRLAGGF
jgi:UPI00016EA6C7 related cluster